MNEITDEVEVELLHEDVIAYHVLRVHRSPAGRLAQAWLRGLPAVVLCGLAVVECTRRRFSMPSVVASALVVVLFALPWWALFPRLFRRVVARQATRRLQERPPSLGRRRVALDRDGVSVAETEAAAGPRRLSWGEIGALWATEGHLFLVPNRGAPVIVPRRAFGSREDYLAFVAAVRACGRSAG